MTQERASCVCEIWKFREVVGQSKQASIHAHAHV